MTLEEKLEYFDLSYDDYGLPQGMSATEFFDETLIERMCSLPFAIISDNDYVELFRKGSQDQNYMNKVVKLFCKFGANLSINAFNELMNNENIINSFLNALYLNYNNGTELKSTTGKNLLYNDLIIDKIIKDKVIDINLFSNIFSIYEIKKDRLLYLFKYEEILSLFMKLPLFEFLNKVNTYDLSNEFRDLIIEKINNSPYMDRLNAIKRGEIFNPETMEPEYLQDLYFKMKDKIDSDNKGSIFANLYQGSSDEDKNKALELLKTEEGMNLFLKEIMDPNFSRVVNILNLDKSIYQSKKELLLKELNNYSNYDLTTIKDLLCYYCFNDNANNIVLKLKTLINYYKENEAAAKLIGDCIDYFTRLYSFLTSSQLEDSPLGLISDINIAEYYNRAHDIFRMDVNKTTDISDILNSGNYKEVSGVKVFDVDIPLERSYFLIHSDPHNYELEKYQTSAKKRNRICMSILDNNHIKTFNKGIIFGYCNISMPIYSAIPHDGQTNQHYTKSARPQYRSNLSNIDRFVRRTIGPYNEITIFTNNEVLMPSYIFVPNREPNELELKTAKEYNIPIFIYHQKEIDYKFEEGYDVEEAFDYYHDKLNYIPNENQIKNTL